MKPPKMIDNRQNGTVVQELKENIGKGTKLSIMTAYFTIYAFSELKKELEKVDHVRMIFTDPAFLKEKKEINREYYIDKNQGQSVEGNIYEIKLRSEMNQAAIARECAKWLEEKAEVKSFKTKNSAQPRLIYAEKADDALSINGTVDFTSEGLGIVKSDRIDSNMCMYGKEFTTHFLQMFDAIWEDTSAVEDMKESLLNQVQTLYKENTPEFIYFVTLYHIFHQYLDELSEDSIIKTRTGFKETQVWNTLYQFQKDGVIGAIDKIEKYGGCIVADSVGLGKTFTALAIIKYYELRNNRVLVLAPKKLRENWSIYTLNDKRNLFVADRFNYDILNHTDLTRESGKSGEMDLSTVNWGNYDLVVIDESHNFRNNPPVKGHKTRYEKLMDDIIRAGVKTKVLMLSATPVNNRMNDIKNQIAFITEGKNDALQEAGIDNIEQVLRKAQLAFNRWTELDDELRTTESFVEMMDMSYFKLLDTLTIARSRKHIEKYYNIEEIGSFPKRLPPRNVYSRIDTGEEFPPIGEVNLLIKKLTLCVYSPLAYVRSEKRETYSQKYDAQVGNSIFKQTDRESSLVKLMRVGILKRMESSISSFRQTTKKILDLVEHALELADSNLLSEPIEADINEIDFDDVELEGLAVGGNVKVLLQDMDLIRWKEDLESDREKLLQIMKAAEKVTPDRDAKLEDLKRMIQEKVENPLNAGNKKVIIFTAFADTAKYLYQELKPFLAERKLHVALVSGTGENKTTFETPAKLKGTVKTSDLNTLLTLFSPKSKHREKIFPEIESEIDVLIATDCISEGQNLQDCDFLINYDIHWNPVRIIQRFGRIDRIGSQNQVIQLVNFWPMQDLDEYINLQQRVQGRMVLLDVSATGEENVIEQNASREMKDLEYRRKQLQSLQNKVVDLEDISGGISITDMTFNDFKADLMEFLKDHRERLERAPAGMYAITEIPDDLRESVKPGVIFTLRQIKGAPQTKEQNALFPYYLMYCDMDGNVKLSFVQSKKILDIYKKLCSGQNEVCRELVQLFNNETGDGQNMRSYSALLETSIENLVGKKQEVGIASLFSKGGTSVNDTNADGMEDFELISFLILKDGAACTSN